MTPTPEELRAKAEAATPGPWAATAASEVYKVPHFSIVRTAYQRDSDYIADANPATMLALLDERDALLAEVATLRGAGRWLDGSPSDPGSYWVLMWLHNPDRWEVRLVNVSPAVLNPGGRLLLKMADGSGYLYEPNRYAISHYMPISEPSPPVSLDRPAPPEAK